MSSIPRQPVRMPDSDGAERVMRVLAELSALDEPPALSSARALVLTVDAAGHVDITSNVRPGMVASLLQVIVAHVSGLAAQAGDDPGLFPLLTAIADGAIPAPVTDLNLTGGPGFAWTVKP